MIASKDEDSFGLVIRTNVALLKFSGTISPEDKTLFKIVVNYFLTIFSLVFLTMHTSAYVYELVTNAAYLETAIESFALTIALAGGLVRNMIMYKSRGKVEQILNSLDNLWRILNAEERRHVISYIKGTKNLTNFFLSQCIFTIFFYTIAPLFMASRTNDFNSTRTLPYAFFMQVQQSPHYEIIYILQVSSMLNVGITCVGVDMIGPLLISTVCGHFKVIQEQFKHLDCRIEARSRQSGVRNRDNESQEINDISEMTPNRFPRTLSSKLKHSVNYHRTILTMCVDIEKLTNVIFLTQLIGSTYILSAVGFKLTGNDPDKYKYLSQIIIGVVQLLICNWPPDVILTESQAVADAAYSVPWYRWSSDLRKSVFIVILRAQKPIKLTAGKFVNLSLETFASMVSTAVSFFTLLSSLN